MSKKRPTHTAYAVRQGKEPTGDEKRKDFWMEIGAAWEIDGGFSIKLDAMPIDGRVVIRERQAKDGGQQ